MVSKKLSEPVVVIVASICFGILFWVVDSYFEYKFFHKNLSFLLLEGPENFMESFILKVPLHSLFVRCSFIAGALLGGTLAAVFLIKKAKSEEALRFSEEKFRNLFNNTEIAMFRTRLDGSEVLDVNQRFLDIVGMAREEALGNPSVILWVEPKEREEMVRRLVADGSVSEFEFKLLNKQKGVRNCITSLRLYRKQSILEGSLVDITERKKTEEALRESEKRLHFLVKNSSDSLVILNADGSQRYVSPAAERITGFPIAELEGRAIDTLIHPDDMNDVMAAWNEAVEHPEKTVTVQYRHIHKTREWVFSEAIAQSFLNEPAINGVIASVRDITARIKVEAELRRQSTLLENILNSLPQGISVFDDQLKLVVWNEGMIDVLELPHELVVKNVPFEDLIRVPARRGDYGPGDPEEHVQKRHDLAMQFKPHTFERVRSSGRSHIVVGKPFHVDGEIAGFITTYTDITERKEREKELLKIEKLESLGILAGGIAHDFNNILTGIMGNISFAKVFLDAAHKSYIPLAEAEKATVRAGELAHQLLTFARGGEPIKKVVSPQNLVDEAVSLVLHGSKVKGIVDIPDSIHAIEADEGQMSQVFHNIIINATQAMPGGGTLTVTAQNETLADKNAVSLPPGTYIRLTFADQGCGISEDDMKRIFDPYFTTKSAGNGLGLSSVHSIINRHGGHIGVSSEVGKGTTFTIYLPSLGEVYTKYQTGIAPQATGEHKGGPILVMDDEEMIRDIAATMLTYLGYEVTTCASGEKAVELYKTSMESGTPFLTVIMDLTIPGGLGGKEAAEQILSLFPKACLIVSSGYSNDPIMSNYREYGFSGAIAKPYAIHEFEQILSSLPAP